MFLKKILILIAFCYAPLAHCPDPKPWLRRHDPIYTDQILPLNLPLGSPKKCFLQGILEKIEWMIEFLDAYVNEPDEVFTWISMGSKFQSFRPFERKKCKIIWDKNKQFICQGLFCRQDFIKAFKEFVLSSDPILNGEVQDGVEVSLDEIIDRLLGNYTQLLEWSDNFYFLADFRPEITDDLTKENVLEKMLRIMKTRKAKVAQKIMTLFILKDLVKQEIIKLSQ